MSWRRLGSPVRLSVIAAVCSSAWVSRIAPADVLVEAPGHDAAAPAAAT